MTGIFRRTLGLGLMIVSAVGIVLALAGLMGVSRVGAQVTDAVQSAMDSTTQALESTTDSLKLVEGVLGDAAVAIGSLEETSASAQGTLTETRSLLAEISVVVGKDLPGILSDTQQSLESVRASAEVIDLTMTGLNAISALTRVTYDPEVPLTESIDSIATSLEPLPGSMAEIAVSLSSTAESLEEVAPSLDRLGTSLGSIAGRFVEAQDTIRGYRGLVEDIGSSVSDLRDRVPGWIRTATLAISILLVWFGLIQIGLFTQGWEMLRYDHVSLEERVRALEKALAAPAAAGEHPEAGEELAERPEAEPEAAEGGAEEPGEAETP
ncbi:MAG: hypothetical protein Kow00124_23130 [Anaerolineae bacterium]